MRTNTAELSTNEHCAALLSVPSLDTLIVKLSFSQGCQDAAEPYSKNRCNEFTFKKCQLVSLNLTE